MGDEVEAITHPTRRSVHDRRREGATPVTRPRIGKLGLSDASRRT
jgi:hypothetical protein